MTLKMRQQASCSFCFFWSPPSLSVRSVPHPLGGWMRSRRTSTTWSSPPWTWPDHHHTSWIPSSCPSCSAPRLSHLRSPPQQGDLVQDVSIDIDFALQEKRRKARQLNKQPGYKDKQVIITKSPARFCGLLNWRKSHPPLEWSSAFFFESFHQLFPYFFNERLCKQLVDIFCGLRRIQYLYVVVIMSNVVVIMFNVVVIIFVVTIMFDVVVIMFTFFILCKTSCCQGFIWRRWELGGTSPLINGTGSKTKVIMVIRM